MSVPSQTRAPRGASISSASPADTVLLQPALQRGRFHPQQRRRAVRAVVVAETGEPVGYGTDGVWGSYLHGVFDADGFRRAFLNRLRARRGLSPLPPNVRPGLDSELSRLAGVVKANVDMATIRSELGL